MTDAFLKDPRAQAIIAQRLIQTFTETAIKQNLPMDVLAEAMLIEAVALLGVVGAGRDDLANVLRKAAETLDARKEAGGT